MLSTTNKFTDYITFDGMMNGNLACWVSGACSDKRHFNTARGESFVWESWCCSWNRGFMCTARRILPVARSFLPRCQHKCLCSSIVPGIKEFSPQKDFFHSYYLPALVTQLVRGTGDGTATSRVGSTGLKSPRLEVSGGIRLLVGFRVKY